MKPSKRLRHLRSINAKLRTQSALASGTLFTASSNDLMRRLSSSRPSSSTSSPFIILRTCSRKAGNSIVERNRSLPSSSVEFDSSSLAYFDNASSKDNDTPSEDCLDELMPDCGRLSISEEKLVTSSQDHSSPNTLFRKLVSPRVRDIWT